MTENVENSFLGSAPEPWLMGVADPYDSGPAYDWKLSISFHAAAARLKGPREGNASAGSRCSRAGVSPRIVSAGCLGSRGDDAGERTGTGRPPRPAEHVGLLQREERHERESGARPQRAAASGEPAGERRPGTRSRAVSDRPAGWRPGAAPSRNRPPPEAPPPGDARAATCVHAVAGAGQRLKQRASTAEKLAMSFSPSRRAARMRRRARAARERPGSALGRQPRTDRLGAAAAGNFVAAELAGNGAGACAVLNAPLRASRAPSQLRASDGTRSSRRCCASPAAAARLRPSSARSPRPS